MDKVKNYFYKLAKGKNNGKDKRIKRNTTNNTTK